MKKEIQLFFFIVLLLSGCSLKTNEKFTIELVSINGDSIYTRNILDFSSIDSVDWNKQIYYLNSKTIEKLNHHAFGSSTEHFIFKYNDIEIYRASAMSIYNSNPYPKNVAFFKVYNDKFVPFNNNYIEIIELERTIINKHFFEKAEQLLKKKKLLCF